MRTRLGAACLGILVGCSTEIPAASPDASSPDAPPFQPPGSIMLRVQNDGSRMLYVQASDWSGQSVTSVIKPDGNTVGYDSCELCNCSSCPSCAVCGRAAAHVAAIAPGASMDFPWDQTDWAVVPDGCRPTLACEQPVLIPPGPLTARARYSDSFTMTTEFGANESFIGPSVTAETVFQHPAADAIVISIQ